MRRLHVKRHSFAAGKVDDTVYEEHGSGPTQFIVVRGRVDVVKLCESLSGRFPAGTPIIRLDEGAELEVWEEEA